MTDQRFEFVLQPDEQGRAFFIEVPPEVVAALGPRKRPPVVVTLNGYGYRTTVSTYAGRFYLPVRREIREAARIAVDDPVTVTIAIDEAPRVVEAPDDFRQAMGTDPEAQAAFEGLSYTHRREYVDWIISAKREDTRRRRIEKALSMLKGGKREP